MDVLVGPSLTSDVWDNPLTPLPTTEATRDEPGREAVLDRLLDPQVIAAPRARFAGPPAQAPAWYRALGDPVVGRAPRLLQDDPAHLWATRPTPGG
ncbi:hypothetical protein [Streptomyces sp. NPDC048392]|uniref:hypothetical protein n=1 Tax=Streptomyces sp. NPDC048392 TaxID=3365543 RepID=UPI003710800E